jgi:hypothetical protein
MTVAALMRNLGEMYDIDDLKTGGNMDILNDIVDVAIDKDDHPEKYPKMPKLPTDLSEDHYSVKPKHIPSVRESIHEMHWMDSEEETSHNDGIYMIL